MLFILSAFLYCLLYVNAENSDGLPRMSPRVINGQITHITKYNHHVRLDSKKTGFICGGTIIGDRAILTAAHCIIDSGIIVRVAADTSKEKADAVDIERIVIHPQADLEVLEHDLAVILLKKNLTFGPKVGKIDLATDNADFPQRATIVGWGCKACLWFIPIWLCVLPPSKQLRFGELTLDKHIGHQFESTSRVKACPGDSGGPVIDKDGKLIGVISYMDVWFTRNRPNYFMSVPDHLGWINEVLRSCAINATFKIL